MILSETKLSSSLLISSEYNPPIVMNQLYFIILQIEASVSIAFMKNLFDAIRYLCVILRTTLFRVRQSLSLTQFIKDQSIKSSRPHEITTFFFFADEICSLGCPSNSNPDPPLSSNSQDPYDVVAHITSSSSSSSDHITDFHCTQEVS